MRGNKRPDCGGRNAVRKTDSAEERADLSVKGSLRFLGPNWTKRSKADMETADARLLQ